MGYTKIFAIRQRLDKTVAYAANEEKTCLDRLVDYAADPEKAEMRLYESCINCKNMDNAYEVMVSTKRKWGKEDGVQGYHIIQSFKPGEVTPEQAHTIGMEFAQKLFGDRYEAVVATHLNKHHYHNHIVINSVSFVDGKKYHSNQKSYFQMLRAESDRLCQEHGLSVIKPKAKGKQYPEWEAEQKGTGTLRSAIREDIDAAIRYSYTMEDFWTLLQKQGYRIKRSERRKYIVLLSPGAKRGVRLTSLGKGYGEEEIAARIRRQRDKGPPVKPRVEPPRRIRMRGSTKYIPKKKVKGFMALYFKYLYLLRSARQPRVRRPSYIMREELIRLKRYQQQFRYIQSNHIETAGDLTGRVEQIEQELLRLENERRPLYGLRKNGKEEELEEINKKIAQFNDTMKKLRLERNLCKRIQEDIPRVTAAWEKAQAGLVQKQQRQQERNKQKEQKRRY